MTTPADNGAELNQDMPAVGDNEITFAELTGDEQGAYSEAADHAIAVEDFGTTPNEMAEGESLDGRLAREVPDVSVDDDVITNPGNQPDIDPEDGDAGEGDPTRNYVGDDPDEDLVGRLVEPDEGAREDTVAETLATDYGSDGGGFSAEEAAMHIDPDS